MPEDVKAQPASAQKTPTGLAYRLIKKGTGTQSPKATDTVVVNYTGWTTDGKMFDSSITRGQPATFKLNQVIPGWTEGVQLMHEGETVRFWIPAALAYGSKPRAGAPAGDLTFDVEPHSASQLERPSEIGSAPSPSGAWPSATAGRSPPISPTAPST